MNIDLEPLTPQLAQLYVQKLMREQAKRFRDIWSGNTEHATQLSPADELMMYKAFNRYIDTLDTNIKYQEKTTGGRK